MCEHVRTLSGSAALSASRSAKAWTCVGLIDTVQIIGVRWSRASVTGVHSIDARCVAFARAACLSTYLPTLSQAPDWMLAFWSPNASATALIRGR